MGVALKAPLTSYEVIYTLPMLTIKEDKGHIKVNDAVLHLLKFHSHLVCGPAFSIISCQFNNCCVCNILV